MYDLIGVDEAGRGALAGPVAVGAAFVPQGFDWALLPGVRDSKLLSPAARERVYTAAVMLARDGLIDFKVVLVSASTIDRIGIVPSVTRGIESALSRLARDPGAVSVRLDGLLRAPPAYLRQETIVRGDQTEPSISLASIMAKVTRDQYMVSIAQKYAPYGFEIHKGYGTVRHRTAIAEYGICDMHRRYFIHS